MDDDKRRAGEDTRRSHAGNRAASDESVRVGCHATQERPDLKNPNSRRENGLGGVKGVDSAPKELSCAAGDQVGACVPAHILQRVELISDFGDRRCDD